MDLLDAEHSGEGYPKGREAPCLLSKAHPHLITCFVSFMSLKIHQHAQIKHFPEFCEPLCYQMTKAKEGCKEINLQFVGP